MNMQNDYEGIYRHWPDYEIVGQLGSGGYGSVYEIRRTYMGHVTSSAVKIIHIPRDRQSTNELRSLGMTEENITSYYEKQVTAFQNENLLMEKLKSASNIVTIEDSKVERNANGVGYTIYIKMELLTSMDYLLIHHMLNPDDIATIANDVCAALIACEQMSIVHRDIKPANIFINEFGTFKLGDFGVARQMQNERTNMTQIGTSQYMAPELYSGTKADKRVDIYSLGIMLYRLANYGCFPFVTPDEISPERNQQALAKRLSGIPIPLPPQVDEELGRIIVKACANDPNQRYQSARELKKDINRWQAIQEYQLEQNTNKEQKAEAKQESVVEPKIEPKQEPVVETKIEPKQEPKVEPKIEPKIEPKVEPKIEAKQELKVEPKIEPKQEPVVEPKIEPKQEPKAEQKIEPKTEPKIAPKQEPVVEPKIEPKQEPVVETKIEPRQELSGENEKKKSSPAKMIAIAAAVLIIGAVRVLVSTGGEDEDSAYEEPIHVTKENPNPVIYDGEYGVVKLKSFRYSPYDDFKGYIFEFEMDNKIDQDMDVFLCNPATINNYEVEGPYCYNNVPIPANGTGTMQSYFSEEDIPSDIGEYDSIDGFVGFSYAGDEILYSLEVIFDIDACEN